MATRSLGTLTLDVVAKIGGFTKGMTEAERIADRKSREIAAKQKARAKEVEQAWTAMSRAIGVAAGALGSAFAAFSGLERVAGVLSKFQDFADVVGDSAAAVASLKTSSDVSGVALETVTSASVRLTAALSKTDDEAKGVGAALKALNISIDDFKRLSPTEQIEQVAKSLAKFRDGAEKTAIAVELFGRAGAELLPFLKELGQRGRVQIISQADIDAADKFADTVADLRSQLTQLGQVVLAQALPPFQSFVEEVGKADEALSVFRVAGAAIKTFFETIVVVGANVIFVFKGIGTEIGGIAAQLAALARGDIKGFTAISDAMKEDAARARAELDRFEQRILNSEVFSAATRLGQDSRELARRGRGPATLPQINTSGLNTDRPARGARSGRDERLEAARRQQQQYFQWLDDQRERQEEEAREYAENLNRIEKESLDARQLQMKQYFDFIDQQAEEADEAARIAAGIGDSMKETNDAARDLGLTFASAFEDAIVEGKKLSDVLKAIEQDIIRIVTRRLVTEPLADFVTDAAKSGGGILGSLAGLLGFRAQGGPVMAGGAYVVGENGPELFQPDTAGTVIPAPQTQKMLGGSRINIVQNFAPGTDRRTIEQAAAMTGIAVQRAVARQT